jgi:hypothetical protein
MDDRTIDDRTKEYEYKFRRKIGEAERTPKIIEND